MEITTLEELPLSLNTKAVIFDCFGTIMEITNKQHPYRFLVKYLSQRGYKNPDFAVWIMTNPVSLESIEKASGIEIDQQAKIDFKNLLQKDLHSIIAYPEVNRLLGNLKRAQIKTMLCSNLAEPYGKAAKSKTLPLDYYLLSYEIGYIKPQKEIYQRCQDELGLNKEQIIFVGDTYEDDYKGAAEFGFDSYWLTR